MDFNIPIQIEILIKCQPKNIFFQNQNFALDEYIFKEKYRIFDLLVERVCFNFNILRHNATLR